MKLHELFERKKVDYFDAVVLIKSGKFYVTFDYDAEIIHKLLNYKIVHHRIGFPENALDQVIACLKENHISYVKDEETFLELIYSSHTKNIYRMSYNYLMSDDPNFIEKYYYSKLNEMDITKEFALDKTITGNLNLDALNAMGISLSNLKDMTNEEINKAQDKAYEYFEVDAESVTRDKDLNNALDYYKMYGKKITSGNGYVDILLLMSVIVTSLSVISIIIFSII